MNAPQIGARVEILCHNETGAFFESAVVVDQQTDHAIGVVLEMQFEDARCVQRMWPSPAIRLAA